MSTRVAKWVGAVVAVAAVAGLAVYFAYAGLDKADKLGSVIGALLGAAGLALAAYGTFATREPPAAVGEGAGGARGEGAGGVRDEGAGGVRNEISGGTFHGPVIQGRDVGMSRRDETPPAAGD